MIKRIAAAVIIGGLAITGLSACNFVAPQRTTEKYLQGDGPNANFGDGVQIKNVLLITKNGHDANLVMTVVNPKQVEGTITVADGNTEQDVQLTKKTMSRFGFDDQPEIIFDRTGKKPGQNTTVTFTFNGDEKKLRVPLLDGSLPQYRTLVPTPAPTSTTGTPTPTKTP